MILIVDIFSRCDFTLNVCSRFQNGWAHRISADLLFSIVPLFVQRIRLKVGRVRSMETKRLTLLVKVFFQSRFLQRGSNSIATVFQFVFVSDLTAILAIDVIITSVMVRCGVQDLL